jgi:hypothetical protein
MPDIEFIRGEIERMRRRVQRQRSEIINFNESEYRAPRPRRCSTECSARSTISAPSAKGSSINPVKTTLCEVGHGEMVRR